MKKILLLSVLLLIVMVGCKNPSSSSSEDISSDTSSSVVSEDKFSSEVRERLKAISENNLTETRYSYTIRKDGVTYYDSYTVSYYDEVNNYESILITTRRHNDFSTPEGFTTINKTIYYDGFYSYTSRDDGVYLKESCKKEISFYELGFDFEKCDSLEIKDSSVMDGVVSGANVNGFYYKTLNDVSSISVSIEMSGNSLQEISLSYIQNGYTIDEKIKYSENPHTISLPKVIKNA